MKSEPFLSSFSFSGHSVHISITPWALAHLLDGPQRDLGVYLFESEPHVRPMGINNNRFETKNQKR